MPETEANTALATDVQALLQEVLSLIRDARLTDAEALLYAILNSHPADPNALQLFGILRRDQGRLEESEEFYRQSVKVQPNQPHVWHNFGNLLRATGKTDGSIESQQAAIALKPNYAEAHLALGLALLDKGDRENLDRTDDRVRAETAIRKALHIRPGYTQALRALAVALNALERPKEAEAILSKLLANAQLNSAEEAEIYFNLGVAAGLQDRFENALAYYDLAERKNPQIIELAYNRGHALQNLAQKDLAIESYRRAIAINPLDLQAHRNLNQYLYRLGDDQSFLKSYDEAILNFPDKGELYLAKANFLFLKGDFPEALTNFKIADRLMPEDFIALDGLAQALAREGQLESAIVSHEAAVKLRPAIPQLWTNFAETLLRAGDTKGAIAKAQKALEADPYHQGAYAMMGTAWEMTGDGRAERLNDYKNLVRAVEVQPPPGYSNLDSFNRDLSVYLASLHNDSREIVDQTLRGGTQTMGHLFRSNSSLISQLRLSIDQAVRNYIESLKEDQTHPVLSRKSRNFGYSGSWSSRLHDCGFHTNHYHGKGWLSSAYYISVPDAVNDTQAKQGWIKFGEPAFEIEAPQRVRREIQPHPGTLVLFPSYMWHGTIPFHSKDERLTVAFDVVPRSR